MYQYHLMCGWFVHRLKKVLPYLVITFMVFICWRKVNKLMSLIYECYIIKMSKSNFFLWYQICNSVFLQCTLICINVIPSKILRTNGLSFSAQLQDQTSKHRYHSNIRSFPESSKQRNIPEPSEEPSSTWVIVKEDTLGARDTCTAALHLSPHWHVIVVHEKPKPLFRYEYRFKSTLSV